MNKTFESKIGAILRQIPQIQPPNNLEERVTLAIAKKKRANALIKIGIFGLLTIIASFGCVYTWRSQGSVIMNSGAGKLFGLLFSDTAIVLNFWKEYMLSIIEAIPFVSIAALFACVWIACASISAIIKNSKIFINHAIRHA